MIVQGVTFTQYPEEGLSKCDSLPNVTLTELADESWMARYASRTLNVVSIGRDGGEAVENLRLDLQQLSLEAAAVSGLLYVENTAREVEVRGRK